MKRKAVVRDKGRSRPSHPWWHGKVWLGAAVAALVILGALIGFRQQSTASTANGTLTAERTSFDFGRVSMAGGLVETKFPLTVQGNTLVTGLTSS